MRSGWLLGAEGLPQSRFGNRDDWPTIGWEVIEFVEAYCCHGPGDVQGEPFELDDEEVELVLDLYRVFPKGHDRAGRRLVTRGIYSRSKGRRKSELAGGLVVAEALGPVRFDGWCGVEPVGRPVRSPFIRLLATEEGQTGNTYDNVHVMLTAARDAHPDVFGGVDVGLTRVFLPEGGEIRPSTASSSAKDGGKESFAVADEEHLYVMPELRRMHRTVSRNLMKRKAAEPWLFATTTMFQPGQNSVAETGFEAAQQLASGFYLNHREGLEVEDLSDTAAVVASLAEAYGPAAMWLDLARIASDEIQNPESSPAEAARYFFNRRHQGAESAFDFDRWLAATDTGVNVPDGELVTLGFDGSRFFDSTALVATTVEGGHQFVAGLWERPENAPDDWEIPSTEVDAAVTRCFDVYDVALLYADPPYWDETIDRWRGTYGDKRVVAWWTNRHRQMAFAVRDYGLAIRSGSLTHDGDSRMARHIGNAHRLDVRVKDDNGHPLFVIVKESPRSSRWVDGSVAGVLSWEARGDAVARGIKKRRRSRAAGF